MKPEIAKMPLDLEGLSEVANSAFGDTSDSNLNDWFSFGEMQKAIEEKRGICLKVTAGKGKLDGMIYAQQENPINGKEGTEKWVIVILAVDPNTKGQGIGSELLHAIEAESAKSGATKLFVYTNKGDEDVVGFYKRNGFGDAGWVRDYQHGKDNDAVFLLKHLKEL